jgi:alkanesulfonate monooxygenase SsuD/methylene tetrahydromethanopterin reductase-like flavin-dependent oxidoreductase (luciferase family)
VGLAIELAMIAFESGEIGSMQLGLYTFGELTPRPGDGGRISAEQRLQEILAAAKLADACGFDVFAVGEHHRLDMAIAASPVVLAGIAQVTRKLRLASAVTILTTADPVKVFEDFATVDLLSGGRAEIIAGRGVFTESFPLFGYDAADSDSLFAEKIDLLLRLNAAERVTWKGRFRPPLHDAPIPPRPVQAQLPIWVGTGGTRDSVVRAGKLGLPLALANISVPPARFAPLIDLYRQTGIETGHRLQDLKVSIATHLHVARNSQDAMDTFYPFYASYFRSHSPDPSRIRKISRGDYELLASPEGALFVGSPQQIVDKILYEHRLFAHQRFLAQIDIGGLPYAKVAEVIELLASEVAPVVRRETAA